MQIPYPGSSRFSGPPAVIMACRGWILNENNDHGSRAALIFHLSGFCFHLEFLKPDLVFIANS